MSLNVKKCLISLPEDASLENATISLELEVHFVKTLTATNSQPFQLGEFSVHLSYQDQTKKQCKNLAFDMISIP